MEFGMMNYDRRSASDSYLTLNLTGPEWDYETERYLWEVTLIEFSKDPVHDPRTRKEIEAYLDNIELRNQSEKYHIRKQYKTLKAAQKAFTKLLQKHFAHWFTNDMNDLSELINH